MEHVFLENSRYHAKCKNFNFFPIKELNKCGYHISSYKINLPISQKFWQPHRGDIDLCTKPYLIRYEESCEINDKIRKDAFLKHSIQCLFGSLLHHQLLKFTNKNVWKIKSSTCTGWLIDSKMFNIIKDRPGVKHRGKKHWPTRCTAAVYASGILPLQIAACPRCNHIQVHSTLCIQRTPMKQTRNTHQSPG